MESKIKMGLGRRGKEMRNGTNERVQERHMEGAQQKCKGIV
jgi:hypothetical protein